MNTKLKSATARPLSRQVGTFPRSHLVAFLTLLALSTLNPQPSTFAQGTAFTYQGRLTDNGAPATGYYDILFSLYDAASGGSQLDGTLMGTAVSVTNGLFTVSLDFGSGIFTGPARWLKLDVRTNNTGPYNPLSPRQALTATPYAVTAGSLTGVVPASGVSGTYPNTVTLSSPANQFTGAFTGNGASVSNVNALTLGGLGAANFWKTAGNAGTTAGANFVGTTDNQPLELKVNGQRALRLEPNASGAPNVIGGSPRNFVAAGVVGATIGGGGATNSHSTNSVLSDFGVVAGGSQNSVGAGGGSSSIAGGYDNFIGAADAAAIGGGGQNTIADYAGFATIAGGVNNLIDTNSPGGAISGGNGNYLGQESESDTIAGGENNSVGAHSFASAIGGGANNSIGEDFAAAIAGGYFNFIGSNSPSSAIGGGEENFISGFSSWATVAGGRFNTIDTHAPFSVIGGGLQNSMGGGNSGGLTIAGGGYNVIGADNDSSTIGGGDQNGIAANTFATTIAGGADNHIGTNSSYSAIGGGDQNAIAANSDHATIAGGYTNYIGAFSPSATVAGGNGNSIGAIADGGAIAGGEDNHIAGSGFNNTIAGGADHVIDYGSSWAIIAGGIENYIGTNCSYSSIGGGAVNLIFGPFSEIATIAGGANNQINVGYGSAIGGGEFNQILHNGDYATVPGGFVNCATNFAFAAGTQAKAINTGAFVWGDSTLADISSTNANSVTFRASGGYRLFSDTNATAGVFLAPGGTSWASISDRNAKKDFAPVDSRTLLEKLASMPITQWHYKWENSGMTPHIGPMAQDFKTAFYPGSDDKSITTQEADGVALAAIQGLNQKLTDELQQKQTEITELRQSVAELRALVTRQQNGGAR